ncbi:MAG: hypothetical protein M9936_14340 [Caldilinea sp.]|nr:hypothetical protein [Caldilinea sp.]MCB0146268.1 hypothetical protein [Caldilineaceae bacterium]MCO5210868.1 hypothetical protein [Caldilinea sp.]MCW5842696.1 hypothetical protein [Caldilinea sp.]
MLQQGAIYGIGGRLVEAYRDGQTWALVALDGNGRPMVPPLAFGIKADSAGECPATVYTHADGRPVPLDVVTVNVDHLELVADSHKALFAPLPKAMAAIWRI